MPILTFGPDPKASVDKTQKKKNGKIKNEHAFVNL